MLHGAPVRGGLPRPQPTSATVPSGLSASRFDQGARSNVAAQPTTGGTHMVLKKKAVKIATCPRPPPASSPATSVSSATLTQTPVSPIPGITNAQTKELDG